MTVMQKMISTDRYLSKIYKDVKNEIYQNINIETEKIQAKQLQAFLTQIKYMQKQYATTGHISIDENFPFSSFWKRSEQLAMMRLLYTTNPKLFTEGNFIKDFKGLDNQGYELGESLEVGFARVVRTVAAKVSGQSYESTQGKIISKVGNLQTQIPDLINSSDQFMKQIFKECYEKASQELKKNPAGQSYVHSVSGKIDNVGLTSEFVMSVSADGMDKDILMALKNATFTAKNYLSTYELKFGQTNPFRVFATVAPNGQDTVGRYYRMINCFKSHENYHQTAPTTFYRIRAIYELTGAKMRYTEKTLREHNMLSDLLVGQYAKFLIWNTPYSEIKVIPTSLIVKNLIDSATAVMPDNWRDALYGPISLSQKSLANI